MKKVFLVCVAVIALVACKSESKIAIDTSIENNPILKEIQFDSDGVATRTIDCRFAEWMMYEPRGEDDTTTHEFPSSCIVIIIENDTIDIPLEDSISSKDSRFLLRNVTQSSSVILSEASIHEGYRVIRHKTVLRKKSKLQISFRSQHLSDNNDHVRSIVRYE